MKRVARGLSDMVGQTITSDTPQVKKMVASQFATRARAAEEEVIGIYLKMEGGLSGRAILMLPRLFALNLTDLLMELPQGTTTELGSIGRSALAEVGNLTLSHFLNAVASFIGESEMLRPSPPIVIVDMLDTILNMAITHAVITNKDLFVIETVFTNAAKTLKFRFWVLPKG